jgi:hypothetical protein
LKGRLLLVGAVFSGLAAWKSIELWTISSCGTEESMMNFDWRTIQVPLPVLLAAVATLGYMVGRWRRCGEICPQCKKALQHAHAESKPTPDGLQKA